MGRCGWVWVGVGGCGWVWVGVGGWAWAWVRVVVVVSNMLALVFIGGDSGGEKDVWGKGRMLCC